MNEFDIIARHFKPLAKGPEALSLSDDAALIRLENKTLAIAKDVLIEGVHFRPDDPPGAIAKKALRVNLSDLAAMGAEPMGYLLGCAWGGGWGEAEIAAFTAGLAEDQQQFNVALLGGDTTTHDGVSVLSVTIIGDMKNRPALLRSNAEPGDDVYVSGAIGDGWLGLRVLNGAADVLHMNSDQKAYLADRYHRPRPRLALAVALCGVARAAIDVSDGLIGDARHIARQSKCGIEINLHAVPQSAAAEDWLAGSQDEERARLSLASGGDDYELLFTAPRERRKEVERLAQDCGVAISRIGAVVAEEGVCVLNAERDHIEIAHAGFEHTTAT